MRLTAENSVWVYPLKVWVYPSNSRIGGTIKERELCRVGDEKVLYTKPDENGYIGAKKDIVFFTRRQAERSRARDLDQGF